MLNDKGAQININHIIILGSNTNKVVDPKVSLASMWKSFEWWCPYDNGGTPSGLRPYQQSINLENSR